MKYEGLKISKESIDKLFPKMDIDILGYESPIHMITDQLATEMAKRADENIWEAVVKTGVVVDKEELIKAMQYDRDQYDKGYINGYNAGLDSILKCKDCKYWDRENIEMHTRSTGDDTLAEFAECFKWSDWATCRQLRFDDYCSLAERREE